MVLKSHLIHFYPAFIKFTGSVHAALLLSRLYWWFSHTPTKLKVTREGKLWLVKSHTEWLEECGLTRQMVRRAETKLMNLNLMERKLWKFNKTPTNHYHLDVEKLLRLVRSNQPPMVGMNQSITIGTTVPKVTNKTQLLSDADASREDTEEHVAERTAREVLEGIQKKINSAPSKPQKVSAKSLSMFWTTLVPKHFDTGLLKPHTMRELGMLSQYIKITGTHAYPAMKWAIENWAKFRYRAKEELDEEVAAKPVVSSLLKACVVAVEGYQKAGAKVHSPRTLQTSAKPESGRKEERPATKAEVEAMLKSVDDDEE
jgi:hypothetical protein